MNSWNNGFYKGKKKHGDIIGDASLEKITSHYTNFNGENIANLERKRMEERKRKVDVKLDKGAYMPTRAHDLDAGYDIRTPYEFDVNAMDHITVPTGVHIAIPKGYVGMLKAKSGLNINYSILGEGVIDAGYTGAIAVKLYNHGIIPIHFVKGDKIIQLVLLPIFTPELHEVDELIPTERGDNGFGSTGR